MTTEQLKAAMEVAHRAADSRNKDLAVCEIRFTFPFRPGEGREDMWHCILDSGLDDGDEYHSFGEFLGVGTTAEVALANAVDNAAERIRGRASLDRDFLGPPLKALP